MFKEWVEHFGADIYDAHSSEAFCKQLATILKPYFPEDITGVEKTLDENTPVPITQ